MRREALTVLKILGKNQKTRNTGGWKPYMIMPVSVHQYHCPATRLDRERGSCTCGAVELQREFEVAWADFKKKVRFMTKFFGPGGASRVQPLEKSPEARVNWRAVWKAFKRWVDEDTVGVVPWPDQKRKIQSLVRRCSSK